MSLPEEIVGVSAVPPEFSRVAADMFGNRLPLAQQYASLLANEGIEWGLIGPREYDRIWERHIMNSLCVSALIPKGLFVADLGSGAGLPGIVLAIAREDLYVDLVEPMGRRCDFLSMCVAKLGLSETVNVVRTRVEDYQVTPDVLTCRALANMSSLVELTSRFIPPGTLLAIKGEKAPAEVESASTILRTRGLQAEIIRPTMDNIQLGTVVRVSSDMNMITQ